MDFMLPIVDLDQEHFETYVAALKTSNLPNMIRGELVDLLETALDQTNRAKEMGWL